MAINGVQFQRGRPMEAFLKSCPDDGIHAIALAERRHAGLHFVISPLAAAGEGVGIIHGNREV